MEIKLPPELSFIPNEGDNYTFKTIEPPIDDTDTPDLNDKENTEINGDDYNSLLELANKLMQEDNKYLEDQYASILVLDLGKINANSTTKKTLKFTAKSYENVKVEVKASVSYDNAEPIVTNTISNIIKKVSFNTQIVSKYTSRKEGENYSFQSHYNRLKIVIVMNMEVKITIEKIQL